MKPGSYLSMWRLHWPHATGSGSKIHCHTTAIKEAFMLLYCEYLESSDLTAGGVVIPNGQHHLCVW